MNVATLKMQMQPTARNIAYPFNLWLGKSNYNFLYMMYFKVAVHAVTGRNGIIPILFNRHCHSFSQSINI